MINLNVGVKRGRERGGDEAQQKERQTKAGRAVCNERESDMKCIVVTISTWAHKLD